MPEEGKENMPTPEQQPKEGGLKQPKEPSFEEKIRSLIEPPKEGGEPSITDERLIRLAELAIMPHNQTPEGLRDLLATGNGLFLDEKNKIPKSQWEELGRLIEQERERLISQKREKIAGSRQPAPRPIQEVKVDLGPLRQALSEGIEIQRLTFEQFIGLAERQTQELADSLRRISPEKERKRWVDVEYNQEFYTRFTPTLEPRFFTELPPEEQELFEDRWQLARAAFYKKTMAGSPEKLTENQDLQLLKIGQMERLYRMPGVRQALEWYVDVIVNNRVVKLSDGKEMTIWDCLDERDFKKFRERMREEAIPGLEGLAAKEADAVAWNWIFCSNLIEACDSRYPAFKSGKRHGRLPGVLVSDSLRAVFHPQEKFESKCQSGEEWGAFGKWGVNQIKRIKKEANFNKDRDKLEFQSGSRPSQYWTFERRGNVLRVYAPECYPTTLMLSFWENVKPEGVGKTLLEFLLDKKPIPWDEIKTSQPWGGYLAVKLKKAVQLSKYFGGENRFEEAKDKEWVDPLLDIYERLELEKALGEDGFHNLKIWAFRASIGGVGKPHEKRLTSPIHPHYLKAYAIRLRNSRLGYLKRGAMGDWTGENLDPK